MRFANVLEFVGLLAQRGKLFIDEGISFEEQDHSRKLQPAQIIVCLIYRPALAGGTFKTTKVTIRLAIDNKEDCVEINFRRLGNCVYDNRRTTPARQWPRAGARSSAIGSVYLGSIN